MAGPIVWTKARVRHIAGKAEKAGKAVESSRLVGKNRQGLRKPGVQLEAKGYTRIDRNPRPTDGPDPFGQSHSADRSE